MMNEMQNRDLRAPEFRATQDSFTVVLWRSSVNLSNKADEIISAIKNTEPTHKNDTTNMLSNTMKIRLIFSLLFQRIKILPQGSLLILLENQLKQFAVI